MSTEHEELHRLVRETRQRLESLVRAGLDRIQLPETFQPISLPAQSPAASPAEGSTATTTVETVAPRAKPASAAPKPATPSKPATASSLFGETTFTAPVLPPQERIEQLELLSAEVAACERCPLLVANRTQTVFGVGSPTARLMFVGEGPGADEDRTGVPFVGKAGALLTDMITKGMGLSRDDVYIANVVKSRPPENRTPTTEEIKNCLPFLERQIEIIRPEFLCLLGKTAVVALLETGLPMNRLRGRWHRYRGIPTIVTWHPAYILRTPSSKRETWEDLQILMNAMGLKIPGRKKEEDA